MSTPEQVAFDPLVVSTKVGVNGHRRSLLQCDSKHLIHMKAFLVSEMNFTGKCLCFKSFTNKENQCD